MMVNLMIQSLLSFASMRWLADTFICADYECSEFHCTPHFSGSLCGISSMCVVCWLLSRTQQRIRWTAVFMDRCHEPRVSRCPELGISARGVADAGDENVAGYFGKTSRLSANRLNYAISFEFRNDGMAAHQPWFFHSCYAVWNIPFCQLRKILSLISGVFASYAQGREI
jgi:hypothetical protein